MARSILDIVIKLTKQGGADKETIKGLVQVKSAILDTVAVAGSFVAAGYTVMKVLDATAGKFISYADKVRRITDATGTTAESSSKLIQILDDMKISYEDLEKVVAKNGKTFDFSVEGLADMSDAYLRLGDAQEQAKFMQERFGKQWISFVPLMKQGKQAILDAADAVNEKLVLDRKAVDQARQHEIALDNLTDEVDAFQIAAGEGLIPVLTDMVRIGTGSLKFWTGLAGAIRDARNEAEHFRSPADRAAALLNTFADWAAEIVNSTLPSFMKHTAVSVQDVWKETDLAAHRMREYGVTTNNVILSLEEQEAAARELTSAHQSMLGVITNIANENQNYADKVEDLKQKQADIKAEMEQLYPWESEKLSELQQKYDEYGQAILDAGTDHEMAMAKIQISMLTAQASADGFISDLEYNLIVRASEAFGIFEQKDADAALAMQALNQAILDGRLKVDDFKSAWEKIQSKSVTLTVNQVVLKTQYGYAGFNQGDVEGIGYAGGTNGWKKVPSGFPNDSYPVRLSSGEQFAVIPNSASMPSAGAATSIAGGENVYINVSVTVNSPMTIMDEQRAKQMLGPIVTDCVRAARAKGALK